VAYNKDSSDDSLEPRTSAWRGAAGGATTSVGK
jgi:hypothetical protein